MSEHVWYIISDDSVITSADDEVFHLVAMLGFVLGRLEYLGEL